MAPKRKASGASGGTASRRRVTSSANEPRASRKKSTEIQPDHDEDAEDQPEARVYRDEEAHQALKAKWSEGQVSESCSFSCGAKSLDTDEEDENEPMKWKVANDVYCERIYARD